MGQLKKTTRPCFSCGSDFAWWESENCAHCIKSSRMKMRNNDEYTRCRCAVQRDILTQAMGNGNDEISERSWNAAQKQRCPYIQHHYKSRRKGLRKRDYPLFENKD